MKRRVFAIIVCVLCLLTAPLTVFVTGLCLPAQFSETFYGELSFMRRRLKEAEGKKIVVVGNSNVAFGVDSALLEEELKRHGYEYTVCNFGLYGALGTKLMLDLSRRYINEGDIVLFTPELNAQSMSLYFSASEVWRALDADMGMLSDIAKEDRQALVGSFFGYTSEKYGYYISGQTASSGEIYSRSAFDGRCDMKNAKRPYNVMSGGADTNDPIVFDIGLLKEDFFAYVNEYNAEIEKRGAAMYYTFAPMNAYGLHRDTTQADIDGFCDALRERADCQIISNPYSYMLDYEWFYDSNVHLNASGMTVRTALLAEDLLNVLGSTAKVTIELPEKPVIPEQGVGGEGDNVDAGCFLFEENTGGYVIVGLSETGKGRETLVLPYSYKGKPVTAFKRETFAGNASIKEITLQRNILSLQDDSFLGCVNLEKLILQQTNPEKISVGYGLLNGADKCRIYVPTGAYSTYQNNYFWSHYAGRYERS